MRLENFPVKMNVHQKEGYWKFGVSGGLDVQRCSGSEGGDWRRSMIRDMPIRKSYPIPPTGRAIDSKECLEVVRRTARLIPS